MVENYFKKPGETQNIVIKILAIIMAIILWMYVMNEQNPPFEAVYTVPLEVRNVAAGYVVADAPETIKVKIRGPRNVVAGVRAKDFRTFIDAKGLAGGNHSVAVSATLPANVELVELSPDKVQLGLDPVIRRELPVEVRTPGNPAPGFVLGKVTAAQGQVVLEGPKQIVTAVEKVVATIDLSGKANDIAVEATLIPINRENREVEGVAVYPEKTKITVNLITAVTKKMLDIKPVTLGEMPTGLVIKSMVTQPEKVEISENLPGKELEKLEAVYTEALSLNNIAKDTEKEVKLQIPDGMTAAVKTVVVKIKVGPR